MPGVAEITDRVDSKVTNQPSYVEHELGSINSALFSSGRPPKFTGNFY